MKVAVWSYTAACGIVSVAVAVFGGMFGNIARYLLGGFNGKPLPYLTGFLVEHHLWALGIPLPWILAAVWLSRRGAATPERVFALAGLSTLAITFLFVFTAVAFTLPFITFVSSLHE